MLMKIKPYLYDFFFSFCVAFLVSYFLRRSLNEVST
jgi:hypothetical protein